MAQTVRTPANPSKKPPAEPARVEPEAEVPISRLRWLLGWIVTPSLFFGGIFLGGVYLGANRPDGWVTRFVMWFVGLFG
jgi:hypothetical protein